MNIVTDSARGLFYSCVTITATGAELSSVYLQDGSGNSIVVNI